MKQSVKGFIVMQGQRLIAAVDSARHEHLDTSNMMKVLVIGETGSGKSTFINYLTNYFKNGTLNNLKIAIPSTFHPIVTENYEHLEHDMHDKTQSKTDSCHQYMFTDGTTQYLFVDTPGLSDTRGSKQDEINLNKIIDAVEVLAGLTAVIIVVNGAVSRLTVNLRNVIAQLRGNLPDVVMSNVIVILTNSSRHTKNFTLEALELNGNVYPYYMQNSAFSTDPSRWTPSAMQSLQYDWDQSMSELKAMIRTLSTFKTKSVAAFKNMKEIRNAIKELLHTARIEIVLIQKMQDEVAMFEIGRKQAEADTVTYKEYTKERIVDKVEIVDAAYHSTLCQNCNHVCHDDCKLDETKGVGAQIFQRCWAMSNGNCHQCQHQCSYTAHYHAKKTVKVSQQKLKDVLADIKSRYDSATKDSADFQKKITSVEGAKKLLERALQQKNKEIKARCNELRRICSGFNLAAELHSLIDQLEIESSMLRNIDARKQAEELIRSLKEFCTSIEKDQDEEKIRNENKLRMNIIDTEQHVERQTQVSYRPSTTDVASSRNRKELVPNAGPSKPESYASNEVLEQIRTLSGGSSKKNEKSKYKESSQGDSDSSDEDDENKNDSNDNTIPKAPNRQSVKQSSKSSKLEVPHAPVSSIKPDAEKFKKLSIAELIKLHRSCGDLQTENFIIYELKQRSLGKSMTPLTDAADIIMFTTSTQKYCSLDHATLKRFYEQLKEQICTFCEPDVLNIEKVPSTLLYEIAAVYQLITSAPINPNTGTVNATLMPQQTLTDYQQQRFLPPYQYPSPYTMSQRPDLQLHQQTYPVGNVPYESTNTNYYMSQAFRPSDPSMAFSHGRETFQGAPPRHSNFPQPNPQYYMQPGDYEERYGQPFIPKNNEHVRRYNADSPIHYSDLHSNAMPIPSRYPGQLLHSHDYQQHAFRNISPVSSSPMTSVSSSTSSPNHLSDTMYRMHVSSPFRPVERDSNYVDSNTSRNRSSSNLSESNARGSSAFDLQPELSTDELRRCTDTKLLVAYDDATQNKNPSVEHAIYTELQRRCYGDHPLLINENKALFDEKTRSLQGRSLQELQNVQHDIQQNIRIHLINNNALNIRKIPSELIIEAAAIDYSIKRETLPK